MVAGPTSQNKEHRMKQCIALEFAASFLFLAGCDRKPAPLKEGVIWMVEWEFAGRWTGLSQ